MGTLAAAGVALTTAVIARGADIRFNLSESMPIGVYIVTDRAIERGSIVLACLPPGAAFLARQRHYISRGSCADGTAPVGKVVAARGGDTVAATLGGLTVNGYLLPNSRPLLFDSEGRPLARTAPLWSVVPAGEAWIVSPYSPRSFDSRYFGPVPESTIVERVRPLFRFPLR